MMATQQVEPKKTELKPLAKLLRATFLFGVAMLTIALFGVSGEQDWRETLRTMMLKAIGGPQDLNLARASEPVRKG